MNEMTKGEQLANQYVKDKYNVERPADAPTGGDSFDDFLAGYESRDKEVERLRSALKRIAEPLRFTKKEADNIEWLKLALSEMQNISRKALEGGEHGND